MSRARGQLTPSHIDEVYPYQVELDEISGTAVSIAIDVERWARFHGHDFAKRGGKHPSPDGPKRRYCFREKAAAESLHALIGGAMLDVTRRRSVPT